MNAEILSIRNVAIGIKEIKIKLESLDKMRFLNGQYIMIAFPEDSRNRRSYSILSYDEISDVIVLLVKEAGLFTKRLHQSKPSDKVQVYGPYGKFILKNSSKNIFIAGGIGIVPLYSMFLKSLSLNENHSILFYSARHYKEMALYDELKKLQESFSILKNHNSSIKLYFTREGNMDRFSVEEIKNISSYKDYFYYICGPDIMMGHIVNALKNIGVDEKHIFTESFVLEK